MITKLRESPSIKTDRWTFCGLNQYVFLATIRVILLTVSWPWLYMSIKGMEIFFFVDKLHFLLPNPFQTSPEIFIKLLFFLNLNSAFILIFSIFIYVSHFFKSSFLSSFSLLFLVKSKLITHPQNDFQIDEIRLATSKYTSKHHTKDHTPLQRK